MSFVTNTDNAQESQPLKSCLKKPGSRSAPKKTWFDSIYVREFPIILGDNPSAAEGVPITIDWKHQKEVILDVEYFELYRPERRRKKELKICPFERVEL